MARPAGPSRARRARRAAGHRGPVADAGPITGFAYHLFGNTARAARFALDAAKRDHPKFSLAMEDVYDLTFCVSIQSWVAKYSRPKLDEQGKKDLREVAEAMLKGRGFRL